MTKEELIRKIKDYFDGHYKFQKLVYGWKLDMDKLNNLTIEELEKFYRENCK